MNDRSRFDQYREDVPGRANVEDTPELLAYYRELESMDTGALWTVANKIEPWEPVSQSVPVLWRYGQLRDQATDYYEQGRQRATEMEQSLEQYVHEKPIQSLLIAAGVGMLLGVLWKRS